ncbi:OmpA/MotB family protein [Kiloniella sp. b19]|uniref:OmpA/MotB family protein n=1 Tax=Kiloniella sp. GXU_MW_B19 TaxID=3141326 RepID=UPI0031D84F29
MTRAPKDDQDFETDGQELASQQAADIPESREPVEQPSGEQEEQKPEDRPYSLFVTENDSAVSVTVIGETIGNETKDYAQAWLITFTDLVALLLSFFVLLYSMSVLKQEKWHEIVTSLSEELTIERQTVKPLPSTDFGLDSLDLVPGVNLDYLSTLITQKMTQVPELRGAILNKREDRLVVSLPGEFLFETGAVELGAEGLQTVEALGDILQYVDNRIEVAGHADPSIAASASLSNWELSLMRAISVSQVLKKAGYNGTILSRGYGDSRYSQLSEKLPDQFRERIARRVDIVVHYYVDEAVGGSQ